MKARELLVLADDTEIIPVADFDPSMRMMMSAASSDFVINKKSSRSGSQIISAEYENLISRFRTPSMIVDAVLGFAQDNNEDPEILLDEAYPLLVKMMKRGILVPAHDVTETTLPSRMVGSEIRGYTLVKRIQALEDSEVFMARDIDGQYAALKFIKKVSRRARQLADQEIRILPLVRNERAPVLLDCFEGEDWLLIATQWIAGSDVGALAERLRRRLSGRYQQELLQLCVEVATSFAELHEQEILHGDIHVRNILIDPLGRVRLIDFGLAQHMVGEPVRLPRGGVPFNYDPEFAQSLLDGQEVLPTAESEQYSVGAVLYRLWTGFHYLDWQLERSEMLRQIVTAPPVSFEKRACAGWPVLEAVLNKALSKNPANRYPSMRQFAAALEDLIPQAEARDAIRHDRGPVAHERMLDEFVQRYAVYPSNASSDESTPLASVMYGLAGRAYALLRLAQRRSSASLVAAADVLSECAIAQSHNDRAFFNSSIGIPKESIGETSLFFAKPGIHLVRALVSGALNDRLTQRHAVQSYLNTTREPQLGWDLTIGTASVLIGLCELYEAPYIPPDLTIEVKDRGEEIAAQLMDYVTTEDLAKSTSTSSLGVAHGWAGIIYVLMRWSQAIGLQASPTLRERLDRLAMLAEPHNGGVRWPVHNNTAERTYVDGWCNGTAGHSMVYALAHERFGEERYVELAVAAARSAASTTTTLGTLCCGLAGIGYSCLCAYQITRETAWLLQAEEMAHRAASCSSENFYQSSLYKGAVGVAVLAQDLKDPDRAAMPLFQPLP